MFSGLYSRLWVVIVLEIWTWPGNPGWKRKSAGAQCTVRVVRGAIGLADWVAAVSEKRLKYVLNIICFEYNFKCCIKKKGRGCGEDMLRLSRMDEYLGKCPFDNVWFLIVLTHHIHHHFFLRLTQLNEVCFFFTCIATDSSSIFEQSFQHAQSPSLGVKEQNISHISRVNVIKNSFLSRTHWPRKHRGSGIG